MKINKRILRCEYAEIVPEADGEISQERLNPGELPMEYRFNTSPEHVERESFVVQISKDTAYDQNFERLPCVPAALFRRGDT